MLTRAESLLTPCNANSQRTTASVREAMRKLQVRLRDWREESAMCFTLRMRIPGMFCLAASELEPPG